MYENEVRTVLDQALNLNGRAGQFTESTRLLGSLPELDSLGVVALITHMNQTFGITIEDDELDGSIFRTVGALREFICRKAGVPVESLSGPAAAEQPVAMPACAPVCAS
jgi:acyl carrier protein